jgi:hypothetical protein
MGKMDPEMLMQAYQKVGLDEAFSKAIVEGGNAKHIVETWKADWREDNGAEHPAIRAVLEGHATPEQARSLLEAADEHRDLVEAVAAGTKSVEWAHIVLSAGFKGKKEAVSALLDGADSTIIAHILDVELSDADAKAIGRSGSRRKKSAQDEGGITHAMINKMDKTACVAELALAGVPYSGSELLVRERLLRYRSFLNLVTKGLRTGKLQWNNQDKVHISKPRYGRGAGTWEVRTMFNGRQKRVWVEVPQKVSYSGTTNLAGLKEAGRQLGFKGISNLTKMALRTKILKQGLRYGFVTEDEFDDLLEGPSDFNKT